MKKKLLALVLAGLMALSLLAACGGQQAGGPSSGSTGGQSTASSGTPEVTLDTSEQVEVVMYALGTEPAGQKPIWDALNDILLEKLNCTLKVNYISFADYPNKYPLLFSSGEVFDMAYAASWLNYASLAQKGAFMPLDELWPVYAPNNFAQANETARKQAQIGGVTYCVPSLNRTYSAYGPVYRMDLVREHGFDKDIKNFADMEEYLDIIKANYPAMEPLSIYSMGSDVDDVFMYFNKMYPVKGTQNDFLWIDPYQDSPQIFTYYEYDKTPEFLEMMARWNEKGFYPKSVLSDSESKKMQNGISAMMVHNVTAYITNTINNPAEWDVRYTSFCNDVSNLSFTQDAMVISNTAKNPERALALWDLLTTDQDVYDLFYYGILGTSYELNDKGEYTILDTDMYGTSSMWAMKNAEYDRNAAGTPDDYATMRSDWDSYIKPDQGAQQYRSFVMDTSAVETEYSACLNTHQQYWWPLELGYVDPVSGLDEYKSMMEASGIEAVRTELQRQLDEYMATL